MEEWKHTSHDLKEVFVFVISIKHIFFLLVNLNHGTLRAGYYLAVLPMGKLFAYNHISQRKLKHQ